MINTYFLYGQELCIKFHDEFNIVQKIKRVLHPYLLFYDKWGGKTDAILSVIKHKDEILLNCFWCKECTQLSFIISEENMLLEVKRIILNVYSSILAIKGAVFLHSSVLEYKSNGIAILGERGMGKTTTSVQLLRSGEINFIANDKVAFLKKNDVGLLIGIPSRIMIRNSIFKIAPDLLEWYASKYEFEYDEEGRLPITISDLCKHYKCHALPFVRVSVFLIIEYDPNITFKITKLTYEEAVKRISKLKIAPSYNEIINETFNNKINLQNEIEDILDESNVYYLLVQNSDSSDKIKSFIDNL